MRLILAAALFATLAGCGPAEESAGNRLRRVEQEANNRLRDSEASFRARYRQASIDSCISASRSNAPAQAAGWDWPRLCTCATDRLIAGKSAAELAQLRSDTPEQRLAMAQCVFEVEGIRSPGLPESEGKAR